jgi:hypothetical protein
VEMLTLEAQLFEFFRVGFFTPLSYLFRFGVSVSNQESVLPLCPVCNKPVPLETAKTDGDGRAVHEECYLLAVRGHKGQPSRGPNTK